MLGKTDLGRVVGHPTSCPGERTMATSQRTLLDVADDGDEQEIDCSDGCQCDLPSPDVPCAQGFILGGNEWPDETTTNAETEA